MAEISELAADQTTSQPQGRPRIAWLPVWIVAGVAAAIHLAVATRFGWHRDEFYYVISGRHLAWGYVDNPPLAPFIARLAEMLPGGLAPLRIVAIAAQVGCIVLAAVLAAELGGRRRAQILTAAAIGSSVVFVGASMLFGDSVLDQLAWAALLVLLARALRRGSLTDWLLAGVVAGLGLENKDTIAVLIIGIAIGLVLFRRDVLRTPGPWLAAVLALLILTPNLVWQAQHSWSELKMAAVLSARVGGPLGAIEQLPLTVIGISLPLIGLWVLGIRRLASPAGREHRWLLVIAIVTVVLFTVSGGKSYYVVPAFIGLFAAGAVRVEESNTKFGRVRWPVGIGLAAVISLVLGLPVLPPSFATAVRGVNPELMETYGWPGFVDQVKAAAATVPAGTPIFTSNYGEAGALIVLGPGQGLHNPVYSGHNNYMLWGPPAGTPDEVLCVGTWNATYLHRFWSSVTPIAKFTLPSGLRDQEVSNGAEIDLCGQPRGTWARMWPSIAHLD